MTLFTEPHVIGEPPLPERVLAWAVKGEVSWTDPKTQRLGELLGMGRKGEAETEDVEERAEDEGEEDFEEGSSGEIGSEGFKG